MRRLSSRSLAQLVELCRISGRDKSAVAGEERQLGGERPREPLDEDAVLAEPRFAPRRRALGQRHETRRREHVPAATRSRRALAQRGEIARAAAAEAEPGQAPARCPGNAGGARASRRAGRGGRQRTAPRRAARRSPPARSAVRRDDRRGGGRRPPVTVRSIVASRLPRRSPDSVVTSSRLRRVAASICMTEPGETRRGGREMRGSGPFGSARHNRPARRRRRSRPGRNSPNPSSALTP